MPRGSRFTIGEKLDKLFLETIESTYIAYYASGNHKIPPLQKAAAALDLVKLFLRIAWAAEALENNRYILLSQKLDDIGKMLGGWLRKVTSQGQSASAGRSH
jgi:hypothetical protein